ncbi:sigma-54 dependent transcriptional regulator [Mesorhizobium sp. BAC0120]|uniref:sigma-54-dependent transcriptional regulator n=1 Tax=Mesorhizobium sp. BAC0120 TaxID=3090670 RepID=UPI00298CA240|nr:sigma-54 dependent transcriptional regulator [Mesorhizobium sp. BAC0120]MDW6025066.1 sigma-54 dependent transcriptional regulator [Mesorhizobium sp. BAC0120]
MAAPILIVDDDPVQRRLLEGAVTRFGHEAILADGGEAALKALDGPQGRDIGAVILDLAMPGIDGLGVLKGMREREVALPVIVQTAQGGIETVVSAMRAGAFDFVVKPASPERLKTAITNALKVEAMEDARRTKRPPAGLITFRDLVTRGPAMERVIRLGQKAASSNIPILIEGESGVGKELVARAIQGSGERRGKPFVPVNCGAIPQNLVESILFGHEKGAFTGATEKHPGKFVEAHGGTLFLDEIGDLPPEVQVKLLRAVQEGEVDPVGARSTVKVDIRLISATHRDLLQQVRDGRFREDLYYRLHVFPIFVPPLRDRREDIEPLVTHFMARFARSQSSLKARTIAGSALAMLKAYDWPGNIRQLENAVFRAMVLSDGEMLSVEDFPQIRAQLEDIPELKHTAVDTSATSGKPEQLADASTATRDANAASGLADRRPMPAGIGALSALDQNGNVRTLAEVELEMIRLAIEHYGGQMSEVARRLGIGRSTLYRKLKEYGIDPETGRG